MSSNKVICLECGHATKSTNLPQHVLFHHYLPSKEYYDKHLKKEGDGICEMCPLPTDFVSISHGYKKCCSDECMTKSKVKGMKATKLEKYGDEN